MKTFNDKKSWQGGEEEEFKMFFTGEHELAC